MIPIDLNEKSSKTMTLFRHITHQTGNLLDNEFFVKTSTTKTNSTRIIKNLCQIKMKVLVVIVLALVAIHPADSRPTSTKISRYKRSHLHEKPKIENDVYEKILKLFNTHPYLCIGSFSMLCFWFSLCVLIPKQCIKRNGKCYWILCKCFCYKY